MKKIKELLKMIFFKEISTCKLIKNGMSVGENFLRMGSTFIDISHCWLISIGNNVTISTRCIILAHDASTKSFLGYTKIGTVKIGDNVFIGAGSIILPNTEIGENTIVGAGSLLNKKYPPNVVLAGNPARIVSEYEEYVYKNTESFKQAKKYNEEYLIKNITLRNKEKMQKELTEIGYII